jgi:hypothetical protein
MTKEETEAYLPDTIAVGYCTNYCKDDVHVHTDLRRAGKRRGGLHAGSNSYVVGETGRMYARREIFLTAEEAWTAVKEQADKEIAALRRSMARWDQALAKAEAVLSSSADV